MRKIIIIIWILGWVAIFRRNIYHSTRILPIQEKVPCVYQAFSISKQSLWVVSYLWSWIRISARHVIDPDHTEDLAIATSSGQIIWLWMNRQNIGNDIWLFELHDMTDSMLHLFNENTCDTSFNGLITYISGNLQKIPVTWSGTFLDYNPNYGQSGSPLFSGWKIIWIISRKYDGGAIIVLLQ